ncbi:PorP/SprF family type IX secretion system membrane protein [Aquimarina sediminis]|uniref:PorP/SprF family type IX secretion system membrane protein n=1 Tax=Aquimarina sediminis TaxID=2070536 RepID=UPI000CA00F70|nr:PorP/SprF family type IX secretion system membrane protein [Aquimarina sediminis]
MVRKLLLIIVCVSFNLLRGQDEKTTTYGILPTDIPTHNLVKYNRFYFNPTFSLVRENKKSINVYNKTQWASFNDNPQTFLINYTANFDERIGVSIGLHQQNEGIYRYFGGIANFAYNVEIDRDMNLTFGMNLGFSQSGIKSNIDSATSIILNNGVEVSDPIILNYENSSVFQITPGVNFNYNEFDVGVSVSNLVAYNLTSSELLTDNMAFTGHVMYTRSLTRRSDKIIRGIGYANMLPDTGTETSSLRYGGNVIVELPALGWAQAGYNSFYGVSLGIGGNITSNVSVGYTYETGFGDTSNFGATHEVGLAYNFETEKPRRRSKSKTSTQKAYEARDSEIRRLKKEILEQNKVIRDLQNERGDSQSQDKRAMSELERSIAEAKEKEAKAARELELQREEEVKLLNKQAEEERLAAQRRIEREESEQKAEEERLAAQRRIEREESEQKAEEERLAAQRRIEREEAEQKAEEERLAAQRRIEREESEQKAEEERLAAQRKIEREVSEQKAQEERIAAEEAAREAEAAKQQQVEEERLAAQRELEREEAEQKAEEERLAAQRELEREVAEQKAEEERLAAQKQIEREVAEQKAEEERVASQKQLEREVAEQKVEEDRLAAQKQLEREVAEQEAAEAARLAEEERLRQEAAEAARLAEEERLRQEAAAEAARLAEEERLRQEAAAEAARLAEEERLKQAEAAAEAARLAEAERIKQAEAAASANEEGLDDIKKELDNSSRITDKIFARRDSLLNTSLNVDKREFTKLLESLVNMDDDAEEAKKDPDPSSSKKLTARNRFVKFAETTRPEAQIATKFIPGYPEGYYLIGNVFKGGAYADKFTGTLKDLGFNDAQIILNPENQFQYVAIESYTDKNEVTEKYLNNIDNRYFGDMWILHIAKSRVESYKKLLQETRLIKDTVKDDTVLAESLSYIGGHNIENGYYLITNIFKRENYFERGMAKLRSQGLEPQYFRNPKDNYIYVYLKRFDNLDEAKQSLFSNVNNSYDGDLYILKIQ